MLDAACPGEVFTSPTPDQMLEATKAVDGGAGVLHIVKNYTGDVLNFEMAADLAKGEGIEVEAVVTNDDVAVAGQPLHRRPPRRRHHRDRREDLRRGRRGGQVARRGRRALPQGQRPGPQHGHGADAVHHARLRRAELRARPTTRWRSASASTASRGATGRSSGPASQIVERLATAVVEDLPYESGDKVLAFVNGMGGTPLIELYIVYRELNKFLEGRGITIERQLIGNYITSLEMAGCSITLLKLDDELTAAVGRARATRRRCAWADEHHRRRPSATGSPTSPTAIAEHRARAGQARHGDRRRRPRHEHGPGDAARRSRSSTRTEGDDIGALLKTVGMALVSNVGGAAGPLYGTLFLQMGTAAAGQGGARPRGLDRGAGRRRSTASRRAARPSRATRRCSTRCCPRWRRSRPRTGRSSATRCAARPTPPKEGMRATIPLEARKGRASYLGPRSVGHQDPGRDLDAPAASTRRQGVRLSRRPKR